MIVGSYFHGDSTRIGLIQHSCYGEALHIIVNFASAKHRKAERVVSVRTELSDLRDELISFDHRTLQWLHDRIAAAFRMEYCPNADFFTYKIPDPHTPDETVTLWFDFLRKELERVFAEYLQLPRLILTAALYPNPDQKGKDAEDELYEMTMQLYPDIEINHTEGEKGTVDLYQSKTIGCDCIKPEQSQTESQFDHELLLDGMTLAGAYFEIGVHDFSDYAAAMINDLGTEIKPYLLSFWEGIRAWEDFDTQEMTSVESSKRMYEKLLLEHEHGLSTQMVANIRKERQNYEREEVMHNQSLHKEILETWRQDSPQMTARLNKQNLLDDLAFVVQERMWQAKELYQASGMPRSDAKEQAYKDHLMLEPENLKQ
ncbi:hypothetical protein [Psychrobacter proteolyticus]|uniref:Uncharacterized protein n=1 Tax=Psychrobacter proteolyticus TaxID=147825 RepID=A0ABV0D9B4_9GAMM